MDDTLRQHHADRLSKLLHQGRHSMAAAHIRACLHKQGVALPSLRPAAPRGQAGRQARDFREG